MKRDEINRALNKFLADVSAPDLERSFKDGEFVMTLKREVPCVFTVYEDGEVSKVMSPSLEKEPPYSSGWIFKRISEEIEKTL